jgi:hypothetical protein
MRCCCCCYCCCDDDYVVVVVVVVVVYVATLYYSSTVKYYVTVQKSIMTLEDFCFRIIMLEKSTCYATAAFPCWLSCAAIYCLKLNVVR